MLQSSDAVDSRPEAVAEGVLRRAEYDALLREYFTLASTKAALEIDHDREALADCREYGALCERLDRLEDDLDETLADLSPGEAYAVAVYGNR